MSTSSAAKPARYGRYEIIEEIEPGAMGRLYKAREPGGGYVAIKVPNEKALGSVGLRERFLTESRMLRKVTSMYCARILDISNSHESIPWFTMEYHPMLNLQQYVAAYGSLNVGDMATVGIKLCTGLEDIHKAGLIHRDLKPSNVLWDGREELKIIDFGIAFDLDSDETRLTKTNIRVGTDGYMSPEQINGRVLTSASDVYALACVLGYIMTGKHIYQSLAHVSLESAAEFKELLARIMPEAGISTGPGGVDITAWIETTVNSLSGSPAIAGIPAEALLILLPMLAHDSKKRPSLATVRDQLSLLGSSSEAYSSRMLAKAKLEVDTVQETFELSEEADTDNRVVKQSNTESGVSAAPAATPQILEAAREISSGEAPSERKSPPGSRLYLMDTLNPMMRWRKLIRRRLFRIAAVAIGVLVISGTAYFAAVSFAPDQTGPVFPTYPSPDIGIEWVDGSEFLGDKELLCCDELPGYSLEETVGSVPAFNTISDNPNIGDERNFSSLRYVEDLNGPWRNDLFLDSGQEARVRLYVSNVNELDDPQASALLGTKFIFQEWSLDTGSTALRGVLYADNVPYVGVSTSTIHHTDEVRISFVPGSLKIENNAHPNTSFMLDTNPFEEWIPVGHKAMDGVVQNGYYYALYASFIVKAEPIEQ